MGVLFYLTRLIYFEGNPFVNQTCAHTGGEVYLTTVGTHCKVGFEITVEDLSESTLERFGYRHLLPGGVESFPAKLSSDGRGGGLWKIVFLACSFGHGGKERPRPSSSVEFTF